MKFLAIIPARNGSKRLKRKNIKLFCGSPLINYTITNAIKSKIFSYIVVSSDIKNIEKKIPKSNKKLLIFSRNKKISSDNATTESVVEDVLEKIKIKKNFSPDWIFILEPTSPLRSINTILKAKKIIKNNDKINSLISVKPIEGTPGSISKNKINFLYKREANSKKRRKLYVESSTIYCVNKKYFLKHKKIVEKKPGIFIVDKLESFDINDIKDFIIAESIKKNIN